ncbi:MAG: hypothetical protein IH597_07990, partial [Bacteroidales bacterium]|nr:hypothetical protein [Bacteroidales bacterium]
MTQAGEETYIKELRGQKIHQNATISLFLPKPAFTNLTLIPFVEYYSTGLIPFAEPSVATYTPPVEQTTQTLSLTDASYNYTVPGTHFTATNEVPNDIIRNPVISVLFYLDEHGLIQHFTAAASWTLKYTITLHAAQGIPVTSSLQTLTINYTPEGSYFAKAVNIYENYTGAVLNVVSIESNQGEAPLPESLLVELHAECDRWYRLEHNEKPNIYLSGNLTLPSSDCNGSDGLPNNELPLAWDWVHGAESYDLEFLFIDVPKEDLATINLSNIRFDFRNATRISTPNNRYNISMAYPAGILIFRARAIGVDITKPELPRKEGAWSIALRQGTLNSIPQNMLFRYCGLEENLNWQYTAGYAEDGMRKEIITFFDGTLRNRQQVTVLNTDDVALVAETVYDYLGRPAVQVMPGAVNSGGMAFYDNGISGSLFNGSFGPDQFDTDERFDNPHPLNFSGNTSKAHQYWSAENPFINAPGDGFSRLLPDGGGYAYTRTTWMNDGTQRVSSQSNVGPDLKTGSGKDTRFFYARPPGQTELDRLFGSEVGFVSHYTKNITIDPNGQASVAYLDQQGRTIATALAGNTTDSLLTIDHAPDPTAMKSNLLDDNKLTVDNEMVSVTKIPVTSPGSYKFHYKVNTAVFNDQCLGDCNCAYMLSITLQNNDKATPEWAIIDRQVSDGFEIHEILTLDPGIYTLTKRLWLNKQDIEQLAIDYRNHEPPCISKPQVEPEPCIFTCEEMCEAMFPEFDSISKQWFRYYDEDSKTYKVSDDFQLREEKIEDCEVNNCDRSPHLDLCGLRRKIMLNDLSPGGQYFDNAYIIDRITGERNEVDKNGWLRNAFPSDKKNPLFADADLKSVFDSYFNSTSRRDTLWNYMRENWKPEWAEIMLPCHPEYCIYYYFCIWNIEPAEQCGQTPPLADYRIYDSIMQLVNDSIKALEFGFWNPLAMPKNTTTDGPEGDNSQYMPFDLYPETDGCPNNGELFFYPLSDPFFRQMFPGGNEPAVKWPYLDPAFNPDPPERMKSFLQNYLKVGENPDRYYSLWYLLFDPDDIAHNPPPEFDANLLRIFTLMQDTLFKPVSEGGHGISRFQFFKGTYGFFKQKIISDVYDSLLAFTKNPPCGNCDYVTGSSSEGVFLPYDSGDPYTLTPQWIGNSDSLTLPQLQTDSAYYQGDPGNSSYPTTLSTGNPPYDENELIIPCDTCVGGFYLNYSITSAGLLTPEGFTARFWRNDLFDLYNSGNLDEHVEDQMIQHCESGCEALASYWVTKLTGCVNESDKDDIESYLAQICKSACSTDTFEGGDEVPDKDPPIQWPYGNTFRSFQYVIDYYHSLCTGCPDCPEIRHPQVMAGNAECSCDNLAALFDEPDATPASVAAELTDLLGTNYTPGDVEAWRNKCMEIPLPEVEDLVAINFPDELLCEDLTHPFESDEEYEAFVREECERLAQRDADDKALAMLNRLYNDAITALLARYRKTCFDLLPFIETFTMEYELNEYYYTLYYYDRAGNLIKTVPPEGVKVISDADTLDAIALHRRKHNNNPEANSYDADHYFVWPEHTLVSGYKYNTLEGITCQYSPDADTSRFWYDQLGRMATSQNAVQQEKDAWSYTRYDELGRIYEVGELIEAGKPFEDTTSRNEQALNEFIGSGKRTQVTHTFYDKTKLIAPGFEQENLRNRVASVAYYNQLSFGQFTPGFNYHAYNSAIHYSYDIHGNVDKLCNDLPLLNSWKRRYIQTHYEYDLVSGNVKKVIYQPGQTEQFMHKYRYDADNRITHAFTSTKGRFWELDARYFYYLHGPLARTELGDRKVQALDYAYTLQGWIKGVNSVAPGPERDMGGDGNVFGAINSLVGLDVFSYTLGYFTGDYTPVGGGAHFAAAPSGSGGFATDAPSLYNGNIGHMTVGLTKPTDENGPQQLLPVTAYAFRYDQLNRLKVSGTYNHDQQVGYTFTENYKMALSYDMNGNIDTLLRHGLAPKLEMDNLNYHYYSGTNQLKHVTDNGVPPGNYDVDIDGQNEENYRYDKTGNLVADDAEEIEAIAWNVYGKVKSISRSAGSDKSDLEFLYDPMGNRLAKVEKTRNAAGLKPESDWNYTFYARDAQGNIMANYSLKNNPQSSSFVLGATELVMYGSSRLGVVDTLIRVDSANVTPNLNLTGAQSHIWEEGVTPELLLPGDENTVIAYPIEETLFEPAEPTGSVTGIVPVTAGETLFEPTAPTGGVTGLVPATAEGTQFDPGSQTWELVGAEPVFFEETPLAPVALKDSLFTGRKRYGLTNHLGNVMATLTDRNIAVDDSGYMQQPGGNWTEMPPGSQRYAYTPGTGEWNKIAGPDDLTDYYTADLSSAQDYYPFGMLMPERNWKVEDYRFGYNDGSENDNEITGVTGSHITTYYREEALRESFWWSPDPKLHPSWSPYAMMYCNSILFNDPLGDTIRVKYGGFLVFGRKTATYREGSFYDKKGGLVSTDNRFFNKVEGAIDKLNAGTEGGKLVDELASSEHDFIIKRGENYSGDYSSFGRTSENEVKLGVGSGGVI